MKTDAEYLLMEAQWLAFLGQWDEADLIMKRLIRMVVKEPSNGKGQPSHQDEQQEEKAAGGQHD